jgi:4-hydroxybenzoate polyprenyltransferase
MTNKYEYDTKLCIIMLISMILGAVLIIVAKAIDIMIYLYIVSIFISLFMLYFLPEKLSVNFDKIRLNKMKSEPTMLLFTTLFGPIAPIFIIMSVFKRRDK